VDDWLERLLSGLDQSGRLDETLVIVTSDHGENFGEGGLITHAFSLDQRLIRVPFVVSGPGAEAFTGLRSLAELPARIASAVGLEDHPWSDEGRPAGLPVAQWDPPASASDPRVQDLVAEWGLGGEAARRFGTRLTCAIEGDLKLVRRGESEELFDLESDPLELDGIRGQEAIASRAGDALDALRNALNHPAVTASAGTEPRPASAEEIEEIEDRMRLLGYM
jgi:arylsulfatase A-like enzyme